MEIEIKGETSDFKVLEKIIRDMDWDIDGEKPIKKPHFQTKISIEGAAKDKNYDCDISYYDENGNFVGLDVTTFYYYRKVQNMPSSFSTPLNIPESAKKMVVTFSTEKENDLKNFAVGFAVVCGLVMVGAIAIKLVINIFTN